MIADMPDSGQRVADRVALVVGAVALMIVAWNALRMFAAIAGMLSTTEVEGVLLRKRARYGWVGLTDEPAGSSDRDVRTRYYLALDTGDASTVVAWIVRRQVFDAVVQGERYRVRIVPKIGYVSTCERLPSGQPEVDPQGAASRPDDRAVPSRRSDTAGRASGFGFVREVGLAASDVVA
jgi:hypothetical protein